jgi:hypothetical protein
VLLEDSVLLGYWSLAQAYLQAHFGRTGTGEEKMDEANFLTYQIDPVFLRTTVLWPSRPQAVL